MHLRPHVCAYQRHLIRVRSRFPPLFQAVQPHAGHLVRLWAATSASATGLLLACITLCAPSTFLCPPSRLTRYNWIAILVLTLCFVICAIAGAAQVCNYYREHLLLGMTACASAEPPSDRLSFAVLQRRLWVHCDLDHATHGRIHSGRHADCPERTFTHSH